MNQRTSGMTLMELLVALMVGATVLTVAANFFSFSSSATGTANFNGTAYQSLQSAASVISDDVRKAKYILPAGKAVTLDTALAPGAPAAAGDSMLAMIVPAVVYGKCAANPATPNEFVAYYVAPRGLFVGTSAEYLRVPSDAANDARFVIAEYRACTTLADASGTSTLSSPWVRLVMDYVGDAKFEVTGTSVSDPTEATIKLRAARTQRGTTSFVPSATTYVTLSAFARNIAGGTTTTPTGTN